MMVARGTVSSSGVILGHILLMKYSYCNETCMNLKATSNQGGLFLFFWFFGFFTQVLVTVRQGLMASN